MRVLKLTLGVLVLGAAFAVGMYCLLRDKVQRPGNISNPKLAELFNQQVGTWGTRWNGGGMNGSQQQGAAAWMNEIAEVSLNYIKTSTVKFSHFQAEITLRDGVHISAPCGKDAALVARFTFSNGQATEAWTDGSERSADVATATARLNNVVDCIVRADMDRHRERYFKLAPTGKTPAEISKEWK